MNVVGKHVNVVKDIWYHDVPVLAQFYVFYIMNLEMYFMALNRIINWTSELRVNGIKW